MQILIGHEGGDAAGICEHALDVTAALEIDPVDRVRSKEIPLQGAEGHVDVGAQVLADDARQLVDLVLPVGEVGLHHEGVANLKGQVVRQPPGHEDAVVAEDHRQHGVEFVEVDDPRVRREAHNGGGLFPVAVDDFKGVFQAAFRVIDLLVFAEAAKDVPVCREAGEADAVVHPLHDAVLELEHVEEGAEEIDGDHDHHKGQGNPRGKRQDPQLVAQEVADDHFFGKGDPEVPEPRVFKAYVLAGLRRLGPHGRRRVNPDDATGAHITSRDGEHQRQPQGGVQHPSVELEHQNGHIEALGGVQRGHVHRHQRPQDHAQHRPSDAYADREQPVVGHDFPVVIPHSLQYADGHLIIPHEAANHHEHNGRRDAQEDDRHYGHGLPVAPDFLLDHSAADLILPEVHPLGAQVLELVFHGLADELMFLLAGITVLDLEEHLIVEAV